VIVRRRERRETHERRGDDRQRDVFQGALFQPATRFSNADVSTPSALPFAIA
jgi:hypothetical protein